ncbi:37S ribosomal protein S9, mitochondrial [Coemansia aciculifera]|uniref:37S ribosomal protein S9, mitochondrial n=1 Tax=Coemansia aciculifera TaxID=417176 RepID=A0ACC1LZI6_9FUNG|nr:37S ribosomal protein S9, mitochondrial [Coemansia aciculifera]
MFSLLLRRQRTAAIVQLRALSTAVAQPTTSGPFGSLEIRPVQRPDTAAYFTRKPKFYDLLSAISNLSRQHPLPRYNKADYKRGKWIPRAELQTKLGIKISPREHELLLRRLGDVANLRIADPAERETVGLYLNQFKRGYVHAETVTKDGEKAKAEPRVKRNNGRRGFLDHLGRWHAFGRRKEATAFAWIVPTAAAAEEPAATVLEPQGEAVSVGHDAAPSPSDDLELDPSILLPAPPKIIDNVPASAHAPMGDIIVNGKPLADYFFHGTDRDSVLFPFQVANKVGKYNVFLRVSGGGRTGQAEACQLAVARALYMSDRKAHVPVREAGLLRTDGRAVERKKTGKPKARKSYTWVKR